MQLGYKSYFKACNLYKNDIVYTRTYHNYNGNVINFKTWVRETMLYKPFLFLSILKNWKNNLPTKEILNDFKEVLIIEKILDDLENNYKIRFKYLEKGEILYKEIKDMLDYFLKIEN